jgi:hypothetical protein
MGTVNWHTAKTKYQNFETNIPRKGISGYQSQFPHSCVCECYIPMISLPILLEEICRPILGLYKVYIYIAHRHMHVEMGAEAALFPEKEYITGIFLCSASGNAMTDRKLILPECLWARLHSGDDQILGVPHSEMFYTMEDIKVQTQTAEKWWSKTISRYCPFKYLSRSLLYRKG